MITEWTELLVPPAPYVHAFRKTMSNGLHVLVAIRQNRDVFSAYSILDHGTPRKTIRLEAESPDVREIAQHSLRLCDRYHETQLETPPALPAHYRYVDLSDKIQGPVSRDHLFQLVESGRLNWESQVWDTSASEARWESLKQAIGFSQII